MYTNFYVCFNLSNTFYIFIKYILYIFKSFMNCEPLFITSFLSLDINYKNLYLKLNSMQIWWETDSYCYMYIIIFMQNLLLYHRTSFILCFKNDESLFFSNFTIFLHIFTYRNTHGERWSILLKMFPMIVGTNDDVAL